MSNLHVDERIGVPIVIFIAAVVMFLFLTPVTTWFSVNRFDIRDAETWQEVTIDYQRDIHREFDGAWRTTVRRVVEDGVEIVCTTDWHPVDYDDRSVLPKPVSLEWMLFSEPECYQLPPGEYEATVSWVVNQGSPLFERNVRRTDTFLIYGPT